MLLIQFTVLALKANQKVSSSSATWIFHQSQVLSSVYGKSFEAVPKKNLLHSTIIAHTNFQEENKFQLSVVKITQYKY